MRRLPESPGAATTEQEPFLHRKRGGAGRAEAVSQPSGKRGAQHPDDYVS
jgi:hypothetical protein